jgi:voltage-gated potassium channel
VSARQISPQCRIIARCAELGHVEKIKRAGADGVVSPNFIGGMRMASEMLRPSVVRFLDEMLRDQRAMRIEEVTVTAGSDLDGKSLRDAGVRERYGMGVLALRESPGAPWNYNPDPASKLGAGVTMVVLGSADQVKELRADAAA